MVTILILFACLLALDLVSKALTVGVDASIIKGVLRFVYKENTGAASGIFEGNTVLLSVFTVIVLVICGIAFAKWGKNLLKYKTFKVGVGIMLAGIIGNLVDRVFLGYVRDFISIEFVNFFPFNTVFNVADICITIGTILLMVFILFIYKEEGNKKNEKK